MPSKSIERIPKDFITLREEAIEAALAAHEQKPVPWLTSLAPNGGIFLLLSLTLILFFPNPSGMDWLTQALLKLVSAWILGILPQNVLQIGTAVRYRRTLRTWRRQNAERFRAAPVDVIRWFLCERITAAEQAALGPHAPLPMLRDRLVQRYAESDSLAGRLERQAARREGESHDRLRERRERLVALRDRLQTDIARLNQVIATGYGFFAECRARADAFGRQLNEHGQDLALLREAARVEGAAEEDLAAVDDAIDQAVAQIAADLTDLRVRFVDELADPSRTLFIREGAEALEEDLAAYEALGLAAHPIAAKS